MIQYSYSQLVSEGLIMKDPVSLFLVGCLVVLDALCLYGSVIATTSGNIFICWLCASFLSVLIFFSIVLCSAKV